MASRRFRNWPIHLLLVLCGIGMLLPFYWMVTTSLKTPMEVLRFPPDRAVPVQTRAVNETRCVASKTLRFAFASSSVEPGWLQQLRSLAESLAVHPGWSATVTGHADTTGSVMANRRMGLARAEAVAAVLAGDSVAGKRLAVASAGESLPLTLLPAEQWRNRRVEITVTATEESTVTGPPPDRTPYFLRVLAAVVPTRPQFGNYVEVFRQISLWRYLLNTVFVTFASLTGVLATGVMAAYAFARFRFPGREILFMGFLALMMIPLPVYLVPSYMILYKLGWIDTYWAMIVPWVVNIFAIFLLRQHIRQLPQDLFDAARIDGCSRFWMLIRIVIPLCRAPLATITVFNVISSWNSFFWPLIVTNSDNIRPLQVGLAYFSREQSTNYTLLMAATTMAILPLIALFFAAQKQIIQSQARSGLKE
jgi:multiple sugar transport system permease protein